MDYQYFEEFHYVAKDIQPLEREFAPLEERINDRNLWQGVDWYFYNKGIEDGNWGYNPQSNNAFYILGYEEAVTK